MFSELSLNNNGGFALNVNDYFKKIYTVAFRLTGDEKRASDISHNAIDNVFLGELSEKVQPQLFKKTAGEVIRLFALEYINDNKVFKYSSRLESYDEPFQSTLMSLEPIMRISIVWRDILGFEIDEISDKNYSRQILYKELNGARYQIKTQLKNILRQ